VLKVDGRDLPESNDILWFLAEGTQHPPDSSFARPRVLRWLLFERNEIDPIAALCFRLCVGPA
jgi:glutathione S-transferase